MNPRLICAFAIVGVFAGCGPKTDTGAQNTPAIPVHIQRVDLQQTPDIYEVVGTVRPKLAATVSAKVMAAMSSLFRPAQRPSKCAVAAMVAGLSAE